MKILVLAFFVPLLFGCASPANQEFPSIQYLLKNAETLDGEVVTTQGVLVMEFEDINLYSSKKEAREQINRDTECISLVTTREDYDKWHSKSRKNVVITGRINADFCSPDHFCPSSCNNVALEKISIQLVE